MWISRYLQEMFYQPLLAALASLEAANYLFIYCHTRSNSNQSSLFGAETREARIHSWKQVMNRETSTTTGDTVNQLLARCFTPVKRAEDFRRGNIEELLSGRSHNNSLLSERSDADGYSPLISAPTKRGVGRPGVPSRLDFPCRRSRTKAWQTLSEWLRLRRQTCQSRFTSLAMVIHSPFGALHAVINWLDHRFCGS